MVIPSYAAWLRGYVGKRKIFLPFATVIARDQRGYVLLQRRTDFDFWGLPGGVLELDEDIETGARRELMEETGLAVDALRLVGIYTDPRYDVSYPNGDQVQQYTFCLEGSIAGGAMTPDGMETSALAFAAPEDLNSFDLPIWYRDMLAEAQLYDGPYFRAAFARTQTTDQVALVRPFIGHALFSGPGASVVMLNQLGEILMLKHAGEDHWRIPSGFSNLGENAAHTAVREVKEELNLEIELVRLIGVHATPRLNTVYANGDRIRNVGAVFLARRRGGVLRLDGHEISDYAWMKPQEARAAVHPSRFEFYGKIINCLERGCFVS